MYGRSTCLSCRWKKRKCLSLEQTGLVIELLRGSMLTTVLPDQLDMALDVLNDRTGARVSDVNGRVMFQDLTSIIAMLPQRIGGKIKEAAGHGIVALAVLELLCTEPQDRIMQLPTAYKKGKTCGLQARVHSALWTSTDRSHPGLAVECSRAGATIPGYGCGGVSHSCRSSMPVYLEPNSHGGVCCEMQGS